MPDQTWFQEDQQLALQMSPAKFIKCVKLRKRVFVTCITFAALRFRKFLHKRCPTAFSRVVIRTPTVLCECYSNVTLQGRLR